ncbi:hypothetical protein [Lusitaniella coriacea]
MNVPHKSKKRYIKNMYDKTALTYAKQKGNSEIVQFLLEAGATEE